MKKWPDFSLSFLRKQIFSEFMVSTVTECCLSCKLWSCLDLNTQFSGAGFRALLPCDWKVANTMTVSQEESLVMSLQGQFILFPSRPNWRLQKPVGDITVATSTSLSWIIHLVNGSMQIYNDIWQYNNIIYYKVGQLANSDLAKLTLKCFLLFTQNYGRFRRSVCCCVGNRLEAFEE